MAIDDGERMKPTLPVMTPEINSFVAGTSWIGGELGPYLTTTDMNGEVLEAHAR